MSEKDISVEKVKSIPVITEPNEPNESEEFKIPIYLLNLNLIQTTQRYKSMSWKRDLLSRG